MDFAILKPFRRKKLGSHFIKKVIDFLLHLFTYEALLYRSFMSTTKSLGRFGMLWDSKR